MLSYSLRAIGYGLHQKLQPETSPFTPIVQSFRAWPWYCDQNLHINNAQYLTFMDFGRISWLVRSGFLRRFIGEDTAMVVGLGMTYRREIRWMTKFDLETQAVAVEGRWVYVAQTFRQNGKVMARGIVRVGVRGKSGLLDLEDVWSEKPPKPDADLRAFIAGADAQVHATAAL